MSTYKSLKEAEKKYEVNLEDVMNEDDDSDCDSDDDDNLDANDVLSEEEDGDLKAFYRKNNITPAMDMQRFQQHQTQRFDDSSSLNKATAELLTLQTQKHMSTPLEGMSSPRKAEGLQFVDEMSESSDEDDNLILQNLLHTRNKKTREMIQRQQALAGGPEIEDMSHKKGALRQSSSMKVAASKGQTQTDVLEVIERNEKSNENVLDKIMEQPSQLLSFDNRFYKVQKKLMTYFELQNINKLLQKKDHVYTGVMQMFQTYLFVGNSSGIIRVFDVKSQKEMKPLMDEEKLGRFKVSCIEISNCGGYLVSGHANGQLAVWDLVKYKLIRGASEFHKTEVTCAKFYFITEDETLCTVSTDDTGVVALTEFKKQNFLGGYAYNYVFLFKTRLRGAASLALQKSNKNYPCLFTDNQQLVAFGALNEIVVTTMRPVKEIFQINKPNFCKHNSLPYLDWGYGMTPGQREKTVPILVFAWDRLIQLVYVSENKGLATLRMDGYYYSDQEINSVCFMGESILFVLVNNKQVKILYTTQFFPEDYLSLENAKKDDLLNNQFEKVISFTQHAELEKGHEIQDIRSAIQKNMGVMNYNQFVKKYKQNVFITGNKTLIRAHLFSWKEYLDHVKYKENYDWLTVLKVGIEIYTGEQKGFAKTPDAKEKREEVMRAQMKELIKDSVQTVIYKFCQANQKVQEQPQEEEKKGGNTPRQPRQVSKSLDSEANQADTIAIKVAIEFCLNIGAADFLFTELYMIFMENGLENKFVWSLEPFILSGQFKKERVPEKIVRRLIVQYEQNSKLKLLEKIIMNLDFKDYVRKEELILTCQANCMVSAFLYLMTASAEEEELGCMQILNTLVKLVRGAKNLEYSKEDLYSLGVVDAHKKYEIEKSKVYIGYKLLWIIKMFLEGKMFPSGQLTPEKWRIHVQDIANFVTTEDFLRELIHFDSDQFFRVAAKLFYGSPYKFLSEANPGTNKKGGIVLYMQPKAMIGEFRKKCLDFPERVEQFNRFLLQVQAQHVEAGEAQLELDYDQVLEAILFMVRQNPITVEEEVLVNAIKAKKLLKDDLKKIVKTLDEHTQSLTKLRIFIAEKNKDYVESLKLHFGSSAHKKIIFSWIDTTLEKLATKGHSWDSFECLKHAVQDFIQDLISLNVSETIKLIEKWFEESYQEQLIMHDLGTHEEVQFSYLRKYLAANEQKIEAVINESNYKMDRKKEAAKYVKYLLLHTKLLCERAPQDVEDFVKKTYYPIEECLAVCREKGVQRGVAVLQKRSGHYVTAMETYLQMIGELEYAGLVQDLNKIVQAGTNMSSRHADNKMHKWDFLDCQKYKNLNEFDILLQKAIKIALKKHSEIGEDGWFVILLFLQDYMSSVTQRFDKMSLGESMSLKGRQQEKQNFERLLDFANKRKNAVLKLLPTSISLKTLTERLNLTFNQIQKIYDFKIRMIKNEHKYLKMVKTIQVHEVLHLSASRMRTLMKGIYLSERHLCASCRTLLKGPKLQQFAKLYQCRHFFHNQCNEVDRCQFCVKKVVELKPKAKKAKRANSEGEDGEGEEEEEDDGHMVRLPETEENKELKKMFERQDRVKKSQNLILRQLDYFDVQMEEQSLSKASFN